MTLLIILAIGILLIAGCFFIQYLMDEERKENKDETIE